MNRGHIWWFIYITKLQIVSTQERNLEGQQKQDRHLFIQSLNMASVASLMSSFTDIQYQASRDCKLMHFSSTGTSQASPFTNTVTASTDMQLVTANETPPVCAMRWAR